MIGLNDLGNITPTVELNALAMKRGEPAVYMIDAPASVQLSLGGSQIPPHGVPMPAQPNQFMPPNPAGYANQYGFYPTRNNPQGHFSYQQQRFGHERRPMGRGYSKFEVRYEHEIVMGNTPSPRSGTSCNFRFALLFPEIQSSSLQLFSRK